MKEIKRDDKILSCDECGVEFVEPFTREDLDRIGCDSKLLCDSCWNLQLEKIKKR